MLFFAVVTEAGRPKIAASMLPGGAPLQLSSIALGDGGGAAVVPTPNRGALLNEVHRQPLSKIERHPTDTSRLVVEAVIPPAAGGWVIREYGVYDADGDLVIYGNFPETYKPLLSEGVGRDLTVRPHIFIGSQANVTLLMDPSATLATREYVDAAVAQAVAAAKRADRPFRYFRNQS